MNGATVLVTGLPRSGTTLTCELLNLVPDTVALDEPMNWSSFTGQEARKPTRGVAQLARTVLRGGGTAAAGPPRRREPDLAEVCDNIERFCTEARTSLTSRGVAVSRHVDGKVLGSKVADHVTESGLRARLAEWGEITVDKELSDGFVLAVKHTSGFAALLDRLVGRFRVYAIVRNPLSILSSWQTVPFPPQQGHVEMGEAFDRNLAATLSRIEDRLDRQLHLLSWFFGRFHELLPSTSVLRYEDLVASGGAALSVISEGAAALEVPLENRNKGRTIYDDDVALTLGKRLLAMDGPWTHFYSQESIEELLAG